LQDNSKETVHTNEGAILSAAAIEVMVQDGASQAGGNEVEDEIEHCKRGCQASSDAKRHRC